jgi:hypothetical protein
MEGGVSGPGVSGGSAISPEGWRFNICEDQERCLQHPGDGTSRWYRKMWQDPRYREETAGRWQELRAGPWSDDTVLSLYNGAAERLEPAAERNTALWSEELQFGPWEVEIDNLRTWILERMQWMDQALSDVSNVSTTGSGTGPSEVEEASMSGSAAQVQGSPSSLGELLTAFDDAEAVDRD